MVGCRIQRERVRKTENERREEGKVKRPNGMRKERVKKVE